MECNPQSFLDNNNSLDKFLVIIQNEDIAMHVHKVTLLSQEEGSAHQNISQTLIATARTGICWQYSQQCHAMKCFLSYLWYAPNLAQRTA